MAQWRRVLAVKRKRTQIQIPITGISSCAYDPTLRDQDRRIMGAEWPIRLSTINKAGGMETWLQLQLQLSQKTRVQFPAVQFPASVSRTRTHRLYTYI